MSLPRMYLIGNLVADPELRFSAGGKAVAKLRVACNEKRRDDSGNWVDGAACFIDVTCFGKSAEQAAEELRKGSRVMASGRLQQREWETGTGEKRTGYEVLAEDIARVLFGPGKAPATSGPVDPWGGAQAEEPPF